MNKLCMYEDVRYIDERCESEYIKLTLSVFFQHQPHKHVFLSFFSFKKNNLATKRINCLRPVFWGHISSKCQNLQFKEWEKGSYFEKYQEKKYFFL